MVIVAKFCNVRHEGYNCWVNNDRSLLQRTTTKINGKPRNSYVSLNSASEYHWPKTDYDVTLSMFSCRSQVGRWSIQSWGTSGSVSVWWMGNSLWRLFRLHRCCSCLQQSRTRVSAVQHNRSFLRIECAYWKHHPIREFSTCTPQGLTLPNFRLTSHTLSDQSYHFIVNSVTSVLTLILKQPVLYQPLSSTSNLTTVTLSLLQFS